MNATVHDGRELKKMTTVGRSSFGRDGDGNLWFFTRSPEQAWVHRYDGRITQAYALDPAFHFAAGAPLAFPAKGFSRRAAYVGSWKPEVIAFEDGEERTLPVDLPDGHSASTIAAHDGEVVCQFIDAASTPSAIFRHVHGAWQALPRRPGLEGRLQLVAGPDGLMAFGDGKGCLLAADGSAARTFTCRETRPQILVGESRLVTCGGLHVEVRAPSGDETAYVDLWGGVLFERTGQRLQCVAATTLGGDRFLLALEQRHGHEGPPYLYALDGRTAALEPYPHAEKIKPKKRISSMEVDANGSLWLCVAGARESYHFVSIDSRGKVTTFKKLT